MLEITRLASHQLYYIRRTDAPTPIYNYTTCFILLFYSNQNLEKIVQQEKLQNAKLDEINHQQLKQNDKLDDLKNIELYNANQLYNITNGIKQLDNSVKNVKKAIDELEVDVHVSTNVDVNIN